MSSHQIQNLQEAYLEVYAPQGVDEERAPGVKPYKAGPSQAEVRQDAAKAAKKKTESGKDKSGYGPEEKFKDWKDRSTPASTLKRKGGEQETVSQRMNREKPYAKRMTGQMAREYGSRHAAEVTRVVKGAGEPQAVTYPRQKSKPSREIVRKTQNEDFDLYDIILSHLLDEGYAETFEAAEAIMVNMSEDWRESIVEEVLQEGEKPFPYEKVTAQQKKHSAAGNYGNTIKMGLAKRRAKEADKKGGSQQDAGKGWYHGK